MVGVLMGLTAATAYGFSTIFTRVGSQHIGPRPGTTISMAPSFILALVPALLLDMPAFVDVPLVGFLWMALLALFNYPLGRLLRITAVSRIGAARAATLTAAAPIWAAVLAVIFLGERPNAAIIIGTIAVVLGVALVVGEGRAKGNEDSGTTTRPELLGYLYGLGSAASFGATTVIMKSAVSDYAPPFIVAAITMAFGSIMIVPLAAGNIPRAFRTSGRAVVMFAITGLLSGVGVISILFGVKHSEVVVVAPIIAVSPLITLILAHIFLRGLEKITMTLVVGALLVVTGTVLVAVGGTT